MRRASLILVAGLAFASDARANLGIANRAVTGDVTIVNVPWCFPDGKIDWRFNPTSAKGPFNPEWTWQLNRMGFWGDMADAYRRTKDERYARAFVRQLTDWLDQTGGVPPEKDYNGTGSPWRTIEEGLRLMGSWHAAWATFADSPSFDAALKERFRASAHAQAQHLMRHPTKGGNWLMMEMNGAYAFAADFPDYPDSVEIRRKSARMLSEALSDQVLPDGLQYELSPDYHFVTLGCALQMFRRAKADGRQDELPDDFAKLLERMAGAIVAMTTPSFVQPRFNDTFTMHGDSMVRRVVPLFPARQEFAWLASRRKSGLPPSGETASRLLPWSGFAAMRSDWGPDATYLCFDFGPLGEGHWHQDKLSFTLWKGGEELVFDDGGGQYDVSDERRYGVSGYDHNVLLVDGLAQFRRQPHRVTSPIDAEWSTTADRDRVVGVYDQGFGRDERRLATHRREIVFEKKADLFTVTDELKSADGCEHDYALLFQLDTTNTTVAADGRRLLARYGRRWDLVIDVSDGKLETAVARRKPSLAGWFVGRNDTSVHPATTVFVRVPRGRDRTVVTRLRPVEGKISLGRFPKAKDNK